MTAGLTLKRPAIDELNYLRSELRLAVVALERTPIDYVNAQRAIAIVLAAEPDLRAIFEDVSRKVRPAPTGG